MRSLFFASIFTLGMKKHRERFAPNVFDLIIVDEFHHSAARSYQALLEHFRPKFLLGLTATPDRRTARTSKPYATATWPTRSPS